VKAFQHRHQLETTRLLHLRIRRPGANRALELPDRYVLEAGVFHLFLDNSTAHEERHTHGLRGRFLVLAPFGDVTVAGEGVVVGAGVDGEFLGLDPAVGLAVSVGKYQYRLGSGFKETGVMWVGGKDRCLWGDEVYMRWETT